MRGPLRAPLALLIVGMLTVTLAPAGPVGASHDQDGFYDLPVVTSSFYQIPDKDHDVLIVPPAAGQVFNNNGVLNGGDLDELPPTSRSYVLATLDSVDEWQAAIHHFGPDHLADFRITSYVLGVDDIPTGTTFDTVITFDPHSSIVLGFAFRGFMIADQACWVSNSMTGAIPLSFNYADMFNVNAQEFGHCLALSHVESHPVHDAMNGAYSHMPGTAGTHLHCVSNLDVLGVESRTRHLYGLPPGPSTVQIAAADYALTDCEDRYPSA